MPLFEFVCRDCEERFEDLVSSSDLTHVHCPSCGTSDVQKLISTFAVGAGGSGTTSRRDRCAAPAPT
ncbi:MAG: zinc ribbon domain-containing protein [Thermoanaerobaculia bacterium]